MFELILIRHGETEFNRAERMQGSQDSPLTEKGQSEARRLGEAMRKFCGPIDQWYVSPQGRVRQTSAIIRSELDGVPDEMVHSEIVEIRCGDWEGLQRSEIPAEELKRVHLSTDTAYPNGESIMDVCARCENFLADWKSALPPDFSGNDGALHRTVVVSHGNLIRCMGGVLSGLGPDFAVRAMKNNTAVSRFFTRERDFFFRMLSWNDTGHLQGGNPFFSI